MTLTFFTSSDAPILCEADRDAEHRRRFDVPADFVPSIEHARSVIARWERERLAGLRFPFAVRSVVGLELLGGCELCPLGDGAANLSYWTYTPHRRRGLASRAVALACDVAIAEFDFRSLQVVVDPDNIPSRRIAERHGFEEVGLKDGKVLYTLELRTHPKRRP